jgi:folate-binding protein YgfZ
MTLSISSSLPSLPQLPSSFAIALTELGAISLAGEEQSKYLQGQVTCDVNSTNEHSLLIGGHCNAKGKVFSTFRFINHHNEHLLIQPKTSLTASLAELKKFGVFAKVTIEATKELAFYALVGEQAATQLKQHFEQLPNNLTPVIQQGSASLIYIAGQQDRYMLIEESEKATQLIASFSLTVYKHNVWDLLEITEGFPTLAEPSIAEYVPQMLNLQAINGISFTKGCYLGQETVARMQYLGKNKRALFALQGKVEAPVMAGDILEKKLGENWRKAGDVLASYQADSGESYIQAVLASDITETEAIRVKNQTESSLTLLALPYTLSE